MSFHEAWPASKVLSRLCLPPESGMWVRLLPEDSVFLSGTKGGTGIIYIRQWKMATQKTSKKGVGTQRIDANGAVGHLIVLTSLFEVKAKLVCLETEHIAL